MIITKSVSRNKNWLFPTSSKQSLLCTLIVLFISVLPATAIQITSGEAGQGIHTLTMTNATAGGAIVQYAQGQEFFVPGKDLNVLVKNENGELIECSDYVFPHPDSPESPSLQGTYFNKKGGWGRFFFFFIQFLV